MNNQLALNGVHGLHWNQSANRNIELLTLDSDVMQPTLNKGDVLFIDTSAQYDSDGIYALVAYDKQLIIRRLQGRINGDLLIISDNCELYPPERIAKNYLNNIMIHGKVIGALSVKQI
jgi:phage repressor protein C with HTH and peptisase S24 domain